jgi:hypothetical protein
MVKYRQANLKKIVTLQLEVATSELFQESFVKANATKSSKRTDKFHDSLGGMIRGVTDPSVLHKQNIEIKTDLSKKDTAIRDSNNNEISCDIIIRKKAGNVNEVIMVKAPVSSINKNCRNASNNAYGEAVRILRPKENRDIAVYSIDFIPTHAPIFDADKNVRRWETVNQSKEIDDDGFGVLDDKFTYSCVYYNINTRLLAASNITEIYDMIENIVDENKEPLIWFDDMEIEKIMPMIQEIQSKYSN